MESSSFSCKKPLRVDELYAKWSKNLTEYCLPLLGESIQSNPSTVVPDTDVDNIIYYLTKHYETLSASSDVDNIIYYLRSSIHVNRLYHMTWRSSSIQENQRTELFG